jgi:16S rRNA G966 N2-methylase RsmD
MEAKGYRVSYLVDNHESRYIVEMALKLGYIHENSKIVYKGISPSAGCMNINKADFFSDWHKEVDGVVIARLFSYNSLDLRSLYHQIKKMNSKIAIYDKTSMIGGTWINAEAANYYFRELCLVLNQGTVIPSYYSNDLYIDFCLNLIDRPINMMDMCAGSGCIGLSCFKESCGKINFLVNVDINKNEIDAIDQSVAINNLDCTKIKSYVSRGFTDVPSTVKFDLITANPPHRNARSKGNLINMQGDDEGWEFHRSFFSNASRYLNDDGIICLIENGRPGYADTDVFRKIIGEVNKDLRVYNSLWLPGTEWFLLVAGFSGRKGNRYGNKAE